MSAQAISQLQVAQHHGSAIALVFGFAIKTSKELPYMGSLLR